MKKVLFLGVAALLALCASCGGQKPTPTPSSDSTPASSSETSQGGTSSETSQGGTSSETSQGGESSQDDESSQGGEHQWYGPDGSELASWYFCGTGSLWTLGDWSVADGVQLYTNPSSETDLACILNIPFAVGDTFKFTNGNDIWSGYDKIDAYESDTNKGITNFEGVDDGFGGKNISCTVAGSYDIYVNSAATLWIQLH